MFPTDNVVSLLQYYINNHLEYILPLYLIISVYITIITIIYYYYTILLEVKFTN